MTVENYSRILNLLVTFIRHGPPRTNKGDPAFSEAFLAKINRSLHRLRPGKISHAWLTMKHLIPRASLLRFGAPWRHESHASHIIRTIFLANLTPLRAGSVLLDGDRDQPRHAHLLRRPGRSCRGHAALHSRSGRSPGGLLAGASQGLLQAAFGQKWQAERRRSTVESCGFLH